MKYRLKDHELQRKLDEITNGEFSLELHKKRESIKDQFDDRAWDYVLWFGHDPQFAISLKWAMLEEVHEYDPHKWNEYPDIEPPEGVWMRVERCVDGRTYHFAARYVPVGDSEDYEWLSEANLSIDVDRFRQWDEEDEA